MNGIMGIESVTSLPVLDLDGAMDRLGGDQQLYLELAGIVLEDLPGLFEQLQAAATVGDAVELRSTAHALKGLVAGCGGVRAASVAQALEIAGQQSDLKDVDELVETLAVELTRFADALQTRQIDRDAAR
jgi:two-component system, sensor histidine kinase and response regulator